MTFHVGVLGLQGDYALHQKSIKRLGLQQSIVRQPEELTLCDALILPGGESTTFVKLLKKTGLFEAIIEFNRNKPIMGTCAGLITLATNLTNDSLETLGLIDLSVERNGFGRQVDSFIDTIQVSALKPKSAFEAVFIRAPRIKTLGDDVQALATWHDEVIMARNESVLGLTFHPELTQDSRIHQYFVNTFLKT